jgi:hypothetical protein
MVLKNEKSMHCNENLIHVFIEKELRSLSPNLHIHESVRDLYVYSQDRSTYFPAAEQADRSWECINCSQTQECGNWDSGRTIPFGNTCIKFSVLYCIVWTLKSFKPL